MTKKMVIGAAIALVLLVSAFGLGSASAEGVDSVDNGQVKVAADPGNPGGG